MKNSLIVPYVSEQTNEAVIKLWVLVKLTAQCPLLPWFYPEFITASRDQHSPFIFFLGWGADNFVMVCCYQPTTAILNSPASNLPTNS